MPPRVVWCGYSEADQYYPKFIRGPNDVVFVADEKCGELLPPATVIRIHEDLIPRYLEVVAADAQDNLYLYLDSQLWRFNTKTHITSEFAVIGPDYRFRKDFSVTPEGGVIAACSLFFYMVDGNGRVIRYCKHDECNLSDFEIACPDDVDEPFWDYPLSLPSSVATFENTFVLGGFPVDRLYKYSFDGKLLFHMDGVTHANGHYSFEKEGLCHVRFDPVGNIWASTLERIYVFSTHGELIRFWNRDELRMNSEPINLVEDFAVGRDGLLYVHGPIKDGKRSIGVLEISL